MPTDTTQLAELQPTLAYLRAAWDQRKPGLAQRRDDLQRLRATFAQRLEAMDAAIRADFGHRSTHENLISEAMIVLMQGAVLMSILMAQFFSSYSLKRPKN